MGSDRGPPGNKPICDGVNVVTSWVQAEVVFKLVPQEFADLGAARPGSQLAQHRPEHAVVLIRGNLGDADGIPLVEQVPQVYRGLGVGLTAP